MIRLLMMNVFLFVGSTTAQGGNKDSENPTKSDTAKHKWLVAIVGFSRRSDLFICTGAAISKTLILSSAWCLEQMPGELTLLSGKAVETYKRPENMTIKDSSLFDSLDVLGCLKHLIYHPCYAKAEKCTTSYCERVSWKCDLVVLVTLKDIKTDVSILDVNFLEWKEDERKSCVFRGFDYARMYDKERDADGFFLVESKMNGGRGQLPCEMGTSLIERVIWSEKRFVGSFRFLSLASGYLTCENKAAGIFLGKLDAEGCTVGNQYDRRSALKFRMSWTYLLPHKGWIDAVIADPTRFPVETRNETSSAFPNGWRPPRLFWLALGTALDVITGHFLI